MREVSGFNPIGDIAFFGGKTCSAVTHVTDISSSLVYLTNNADWLQYDWNNADWLQYDWNIIDKGWLELLIYDNVLYKV